MAVENKSAEEIGDFKDQVYQVIDTRIVESHVFQPVNKRFVDAGLEQTRLRPDQLFVPGNMRSFATAMEKQGQPFDFLLYATLTSGTTRQNKDHERDYLLTMEMIDVHSGNYDKQSATLSKGYHQTRLGRMLGASAEGQRRRLLLSRERETSPGRRFVDETCIDNSLRGIAAVIWLAASMGGTAI